jgi:hypothetical protein
MLYIIEYRCGSSATAKDAYCQSIREVFDIGCDLLIRGCSIVTIIQTDPVNEPPISVEMVRQALEWRVF